MNYEYVILMSDATSFKVSLKWAWEERRRASRNRFDLADLLADGWKPIREIPMGHADWPNSGGTQYAVALILLGKE
jgi:hypothetical protein